MLKQKFLLSLLTFLVCQPVLASTTFLQATQDNTLYESTNGLRSNGSGQHMFVGVTLELLTRRAVIAFEDLDSIPPDATITSVKLHLALSKENSDATIVELHRLTTSWGEGESVASEEEGRGANSENGDATWVHRRYPNLLWANHGGDFLPDPSAILAVDAVGQYTFGPTIDMAADVQHWLRNPDENFGWILIAGENSRTSKRFDTRENETKALRPVLEVSYTTTGTPFDFSGPWFDPSLDGEGYLVFQTPAGWLIYYFGYSSEGTFLWLVSDLVMLEDLVPGKPFDLRMLIGEPGTWTSPTPSTGLKTYGTLSVAFDTCTTGQFVLKGLEPDKTSNVIKIVGVDGTICVDQEEIEGQAQ